jgi:hypothetical protein
VALLLLACCLVQAQVRDTVILKNGQVLIGELKKVQLGIMFFKDTDLSDLKVKLYKVKKIHAYRNVFRIELTDNDMHYGYLDYANTDGYTKIQYLNRDTLLTHITSISELAELKKGFFRKMTGNVSAGLSYAKSSGVGQLNLSSELIYNSRRFENQLNTSAISSIDSSSFSRDREDATLFSNYNLNSRWFVATQFTYQRNLELSLRRRFLEMLGAGKKLVVRKNMQLLFMSGISFSQERSTEGVESPLLLELPLIFRYNLFQFQHPNIQIYTSQSFYIGIAQNGRIRQDGTTTIAWEIIKNFTVNLNPYTNYDSRPPNDSQPSFDYGVVFGLGYKF